MHLPQTERVPMKMQLLSFPKPPCQDDYVDAKCHQEPSVVWSLPSASMLALLRVTDETDAFIAGPFELQKGSNKKQPPENLTASDQNGQH